MMGLSRSRSSWYMAAVVVILFACGTRAKADAYYNVTPVAGLSPAQYAAIYPVSQPVPLTTAQMAELPGITGRIGVLDTTTTFFPMHALFANSEGTVIGTVPNGQSLGMPYEDATVGYAQLQANGQYGPFVPLSSAMYAEAFVNNKNQILLTGTGVSAEIIDLNKGTTTDFASIIPPATQSFSWLFPIGIADNGAILTDYSTTPGTNYQSVVLTPPGVPLEVPALNRLHWSRSCWVLPVWRLRSRRKKS